MNNQPKFLKYLIIIAVIIFIIAAIYKFTSVDNSEQITVSTEQDAPKSGFKKRTQHDDTIKNVASPTKIINDTVAEDTKPALKDNKPEVLSDPDISIQEKMNIQREASQKAFYQALFFKTPEDIIKAIEAARKQGDTAKESEYIDLLLTKHPDYSL